jgi:hypothetical protein
MVACYHADCTPVCRHLPREIVLWSEDPKFNGLVVSMARFSRLPDDDTRPL